MRPGVAAPRCNLVQPHGVLVRRICVVCSCSAGTYCKDLIFRFCICCCAMSMRYEVAQVTFALKSVPCETQTWRS